MTFPSNGTGFTLEQGLQEARAQSGYIKATATTIKALCAAGTVNSAQLLSFLNDLIGIKATLTTIAALSGMDTYAQAQLGASISADFTGMLNSLQAAGAWLVTNFPSSGGFMQAATLNADGSVTQRVFSSASTAQFQTLLGTLIASIA